MESKKAGTISLLSAQGEYPLLSEYLIVFVSGIAVSVLSWCLLLCCRCGLDDDVISYDPTVHLPNDLLDAYPHVHPMCKECIDMGMEWHHNKKKKRMGEKRKEGQARKVGRKRRQSGQSTSQPLAEDSEDEAEMRDL